MGGWCWRALSPSRSQGGVLEWLVIDPGCGLRVGGQGLFHMPEGHHPHVVGIDDFSDAGATAERDPVGETHSHTSGLPSLFQLRTSLRLVTSDTSQDP